jgi:hypothetical protein
MKEGRSTRHLILTITLMVALAGLSIPAGAQPDGLPRDDGLSEQQPAEPAEELETLDPSGALAAMDAATSQIISQGPSAKVIKNLALRGRGERLDAQATTDVWAHDGFAYTGTFNSPCGGEEGGGVWIWDVRNRNKPSFVGILESEPGSRSNDVKVAAMNSGDILVHSNENCLGVTGGLGGFEVYNVDDPRNPEHLATVRVHEANETLRTVFGGVNRGVHNLFLFTQGERDYVAMQTHNWFGGLQIFELTDPTDPQLVSVWGAELLCDEPFCSDDPYNETDIATLVNHINGYMFCLLTPCFGTSQNRFLHDVTVSADGTLAYLSHWDAGLILLDINDPSDPVFISQALEPELGSRDGEVNSHAAWPSEDGTIVVETEEDFAPLGTIFEIPTDPVEGHWPHAEGEMTVPIFSLPDQTMAGPTTYVGFACEGFDDPPPGPPFDEAVPPAPTSDHIALIQRGGCPFSHKIDNAAAAGYAGVVVFNNPAGGEALVIMIGDPVDLPGVFVTHSLGLRIAGVDSAAALEVGATGEPVRVTATEGWGGVRIWDYSDPEEPVLASTFDTVCSADPLAAICDPAQIYSVHNVVVETTGNKVLAYFSWYADGMLVLDVTDPYDPQEIARFFDNSPEFLAANGGEPHDFWGVWKEPRRPWIYGSDRNGGLYVFRLQGSGSG